MIRPKPCPPSVPLLLTLTVLSVSACVTFVPPAVDLESPGWSVRTGQALWHRGDDGPSLAGEMQRLQCYFLSFNLDEVLNALRSCVDDTPDGEWVRGGQWYPQLFEQSELSPREILDQVAPDNPVFLMDWSWHNGWVNSRALEIFGIDADTPNPQGGVIAKDDVTGAPTGVLFPVVAAGVAVYGLLAES